MKIPFLTRRKRKEFDLYQYKSLDEAKRGDILMDGTTKERIAKINCDSKGEVETIMTYHLRGGKIVEQIRGGNSTNRHAVFGIDEVAYMSNQYLSEKRKLDKILK